MKDPAMPGAADRATTLEEQLKDCRRQLKAARRELREYRREERELERLADMAAAPNHPDPTKPTIERYMRYASIAPGLAVSSAFSASVRMPDGGTTVSLGWKWSDRSGRVVLRHVAVENPDGVRPRTVRPAAQVERGPRIGRFRGTAVIGPVAGHPGLGGEDERRRPAAPWPSQQTHLRFVRHSRPHGVPLADALASSCGGVGFEASAGPGDGPHGDASGRGGGGSHENSSWLC